jgi:hypothetical protein
MVVSTLTLRARDAPNISLRKRYNLEFSGHCKKLTPEYAGAAAVLAEKNPPRYLAKVDATENKDLAERFEVKGFPTLLWFV